MKENNKQGDRKKFYHRQCTCSKNPIDFDADRKNNFPNNFFSYQGHPSKESAEFKYINENQNNDERYDKPYASSDSRIDHTNCNNDSIFDENVQVNKLEVKNLRSTEFGVFPISKFNEKDVKYWKILFEKYGNFSMVVEKFRENTGKIVSDFTVRRKLKDFLINNYENWYKKYQLSGKYSWEDARSWRKLYESLHSFKKVESFIKEKVDPNGPIEKTIREYIKKYINRILGENYDKWVERYHKTEPYKYNKKNYFYWKKLYEKFGSLKGVKEHLAKKLSDTAPDPATIRIGLRPLLGQKYEIWKSKFAKKLFVEKEITYWKSLYEKYGSIGKISELTGHDFKVIKKHLRGLMGKHFNNWYEKYYIHHSTIYTDSEVSDWKSLFEMLGSYPAVSNEINDILDINIRPSVIRRKVKKYLETLDINYNNWLAKFSLSDNIVDIGKKIHQIIEYYFMLNFKDTDIFVFYEITPSKEAKLFRIDNSLIYPKSIGKRVFNKLIINLDYLFSTNLARLYPKMYKGYHSEDMLLLIVMLIDKPKNYSIPLDVPYRENVKLIDINFLLKLLDFDDCMKKKIIYAINLGKKAPYSPMACEELKEIANSANRKLKLNFGNRKDQQLRYNEIIKNL